MTPDRLLRKLCADLPPHRQRLETRPLQEIAAGWQQWLTGQERVVVGSDNDALICRYLASQLEVQAQRIETLHQQQGVFSRRLATAASDAERRQLILDFSTQLGASPKQVKEDERAFSRWFGADTLHDRVRHRIAEAERLMALLLDRLGVIAAHHLRQNPASTKSRWVALELEQTVHARLAHEGNIRVRIAAFACLAAAIRALPRDEQETSLSSNTEQLIFRLALDPAQTTWLQTEALDLLRFLSHKHFAEAARQRLTRPLTGDDLFVRRRIVDWIVAQDSLPENLTEMLRPVFQDSSAYVRQGLAESLPRLPAAVISRFLPLLLTDPEPVVRAAAALSLTQLAGRDDLPLNRWLFAALEEEKNNFVCRTLLLACEQISSQLSESAPAMFRQDWLPGLTQRLDALHRLAPDLRVRRWAAQSAEHIALCADTEARALQTRLAEAIQRCPPGGSVLLPATLRGLKPELAGRVLSLLARNDFPLALEAGWRGWRLYRGHRFGFRLWRWLYEMRHPSPDKRQAFSHTVGRIFRGQVHAPSGILAELAETKVPGEPLHFASEAGSRPYLPLVDQFLSALDEPAAAMPILIFTAEGVTRIHPPSSLVDRLWTRARLILGFAGYARLRNFNEDGQIEASAYLAAMARLGFRLDFCAHPDALDQPHPPDPSVARFFPVPALLALPDAELWQRFQNYFFSVFENTLFELALFTGGALVFFIVRHLWLNRSIHRARAALPLVIGGWGTRGKSGTERIKAALFNGLGYSVVSKTTGCEAMFLHGRVFDELREMFLFRPYDKATIWEQHNVVRLAERLGGDVFLWECMALTPAFVQLLQRRWMRDDISTLTNTFPDHEDLQGPAGINIPEVMTNFIPQNGRLLTSEEQMRPILQNAANHLGTPLSGVGWLQSGLLAPDVLARFPYQEHPDNIALVVALAAELGIPADFALKEMADRVVPDLGVLKTYPTATLNDRRLSFANGMSANERFGCLGNWTRLEFDRITPASHPGTIISTVVNNRADRVARSRVFAGILVEDISADLHFLIGSNLAGLQGYIRESWDAFSASITLWPIGRENDPAAVLAEFARRLRIPQREDDVRRFLQAMLEGLNIADAVALLALWDAPERLLPALQEKGCPLAEEVLAHLAIARERLAEYQQMAQKITQGGEQTTLDAAFRETLWQWFSQKIVVVEDFHASGNQIIALIAEKTPPGFLNRIMGIQNIKGTGLDFVYRWQAWDQCYRACADLIQTEPIAAQRGLTALASFQEYGVLCEEHVRRTLANARTSSALQLERQQAALSIIEKTLNEKMNEIRLSLQAKRVTGRIERFFNLIEGFFDAGDAVRRRRTADRIYEDLVHERISHARAAMELQLLNKRQKGGWLYSDMRGRISQYSELLFRSNF